MLKIKITQLNEKASSFVFYLFVVVVITVFAFSSFSLKFNLPNLFHLSFCLNTDPGDSRCNTSKI